MSSPYGRNPKLFKQLAERFIESIRRNVPEKKISNSLVNLASKTRSVGLAGEFGFPEKLSVEGRPVIGLYTGLGPYFSYPKLYTATSRRPVNIDELPLDQLILSLNRARGTPYGIQVSQEAGREIIPTFIHELVHLGQDIHPKGALRLSKDLLVPYRREVVPVQDRLEELLADYGTSKRTGLPPAQNIKELLLSAYQHSKARPFLRLQIERLADMTPELQQALEPYRSKKTLRNVEWFLK